MKKFSDTESNILEDIILHRRDVRGNRFLDKKIPKKALDKILFAAINAPSVGFSQPWQFVIIEDTKRKELIKATFRTETAKACKTFSPKRQEMYQQLKLEGIHEAPTNIAVFYKPSDHPVLGQNSMKEAGTYSVVCAIQNMWLMSRALNIGLGWVSIIDPEKVKSILNAPAENQLVAYLCLGFVDTFYDKPELERKQWEKRKNIDELIFKESY
ncbi:MAG: 5,6-dimethylbenzimidazole synthase [Oceanospirillaceae bacterium]|nr:5,6-dimethylbenzimidazole synthase [Oceanospirillaceae bacterium]